MSFFNVKSTRWTRKVCLEWIAKWTSENNHALKASLRPHSGFNLHHLLPLRNGMISKHFAMPQDVSRSLVCSICTRNGSNALMPHVFAYLQLILWNYLQEWLLGLRWEDAGKGVLSPRSKPASDHVCDLSQIMTLFIQSNALSLLHVEANVEQTMKVIYTEKDITIPEGGLYLFFCKVN